MARFFFALPFIKNLGLAFGSVLFALVLAEMGVRLFWPMDTGESWRMAAPHGQLYYVNSPLFKNSHRFRDFSTTYSINSLGNRGPEPGNEPIQVAFLGDSFTFGLFVDESDTSVGQLRRMATEAYGNGEVGIVNAAIAGTGIAEWIAYLQDYGKRLKPDVVVANLNYVSLSRGYKHPLFRLDCDRETLIRNSPPTISSESPWPAYKKYDDRDVSLALFVKRWLNDHSQLFMAVRKGYSELGKYVEDKKNGEEKTAYVDPWPNMPYTSNAIDRVDLRCFVKASFKALRDTAEMAGGKLVVIDIGYRWQTTLDRKHSIDLIALDFLPDVLQELGIPYSNLTAQLYQLHQRGVQTSIPGDGHPTREGYLAIAEGSWPTIRHQVDMQRGKKTFTRNN